MRKMRGTPPSAGQRQRGVMLIEAMVAFLIFSIGVIALVGLQGVAIKESNEAKYRSDASFVADRVIGDIWLSDKTNIAAFAGTYSASSNTGNAWSVAVTDPQIGLPNGSVVVAASGQTVTVTVAWQAPGGRPHSFTQNAVIIDD